MDTAISDLLKAQIKHEYSNHGVYKRFSNWANIRGLNHTAGFFSKEAKEELEHAELIIKYLEDMNELIDVVYDSIPETYINTYQSLFEQALKIEQGTTLKLAEISQMALTISDFKTFVAIEPLNKIQIDEEATYMTILDRIKIRLGNTPTSDETSEYNQYEGARLLDGSALSDIDIWIGTL